MNLDQALILFDASSQETRLKTVRLLVPAGPKGLPAGEISKQLDIPHNSLSFHLTHMANADLVSSRKEGRSVYYALNFDLMRTLVGFLIKDCCQFDESCRFSEITADGLSSLANFCPPTNPTTDSQ